jgi:hypothetical protein
MKKLSFLFATVLLFMGVTVVNAQDTNVANHTVGVTIGQLALVGIKGGATTSITISPTMPTVAGDSLSFATGTNNSELWLNYSSIVGSATGSSRTITAALSSATTLPQGLSLKLAATTVTSAGSKGTLGTTSLSTPATLTSTATNVITGIGSCHTSKGQNKGSNLTYSLVVNPTFYSSIVAGTYSATVVYTITATN